MSDVQNIKFEKKNLIAYITIDRPKVLNALNMATMQELKEAFASIKDDADVRVAILTGAGEKAFVAGADIGELAQQTPVSAKEYTHRGQAVAPTADVISADCQPTPLPMSIWKLDGFKRWIATGDRCLSLDDSVRDRGSHLAHGLEVDLLQRVPRLPVEAMRMPQPVQGSSDRSPDQNSDRAARQADCCCRRSGPKRALRSSSFMISPPCSVVGFCFADFEMRS